MIGSGVPVATMAARDYFRYKKDLVPSIMEAYGRLDRKYDIIVIEGAGSPAEINLKSDDIVNMGMARMAKAPCYWPAILTGAVFSPAIRHCDASGAGGEEDG